MVLLIEIFWITNYYSPSSIDIYEGLVKFEDEIASLWDIIGQSVGLLEMKLSNTC